MTASEGDETKEFLPYEFGEITQYGSKLVVHLTKMAGGAKDAQGQLVEALDAVVARAGNDMRTVVVELDSNITHLANNDLSHLRRLQQDLSSKKIAFRVEMGQDLRLSIDSDTIPPQLPLFERVRDTQNDVGYAVHNPDTGAIVVTVRELNFNNILPAIEGIITARQQMQQRAQNEAIAGDDSESHRARLKGLNITPTLTIDLSEVNSTKLDMGMGQNLIRLKNVARNYGIKRENTSPELQREFQQYGITSMFPDRHYDPPTTGAGMV